MKKNTKFHCMLALLLSSKSFASDIESHNNFYIGFDIGVIKSDANMSSNDKSAMGTALNNIKDGVNNPFYNDLKLGYLYNENVRFYAFWRELSKDSAHSRILTSSMVQTGLVDVEYSSRVIGLGLDYLKDINQNLYWTIGGNIGRFTSNIEIDSSYIIKDKTNVKSDGISIGLNTSIGYKINKNWAIESGVGYMYYNGNEANFENNTKIITFKNKNNYSAFAGVKYSF
ncbi:hypothetical protein H4F28_20655 [Vibrio alginolyticus]|uniref:hypothetical protein n=1 Tax=Vibrio alginolyticus TaxID=663 RepID=UPI002FF39238